MQIPCVQDVFQVKEAIFKGIDESYNYNSIIVKDFDKLFVVLHPVNTLNNSF